MEEINLVYKSLTLILSQNLKKVCQLYNYRGIFILTRENMEYIHTKVSSQIRLNNYGVLEICHLCISFVEIISNHRLLLYT